MSTDVLLPCPFCGSKATLYQSQVCAIVTASCDTCPATIEFYEKTLEVAIQNATQAWNTRVTLANGEPSENSNR